MNEKLFERRTQMLTSISKGFPLKMVIEDLSKRFEVPARTLYRDWERRKIWANQVVQLHNPELLNQMAEGLSCRGTKTMPKMLRETRG